MGERWVYIALLGLVLFSSIAVAHKSPIVEYTYVGNIWEEAYTKIPLQSVESETITFKLSVVHPTEKIKGNVTGLISIYRDDTIWEWYGGKSYKTPNWMLIKEEWLKPTGNNEFEQDVLIEHAGTYPVFIDWYEDSVYIGRSMHSLDVETRTIGPLFYIFASMVLLFTLIGVRAGVL